MVYRLSETDQAVSVLRPVFESTTVACELVWKIASQSVRATGEALLAAGSNGKAGFGDVVRPGQRDVALERIRCWLEARLGNELFIADPYFGIEDLDALQFVMQAKPDCRVFILTSLKHHKDRHIAQPYDDAYANHWRSRVSVQDPPLTEVVIVGTKPSLLSPIHDRWWLSGGAGLRIGTSFSSIGMGREAELSEMDSDTAAECTEIVKQYLRRDVVHHGGERCSVETLMQLRPGASGRG